MLHTRAQVALRRGHDTAAEALREVFQELLTDEQPLRRMGALVAGSKTLTASVTWVDEATRGPAKDFQKLVDGLVQEVFCGGQAGAAAKAKPAQ
ncbi:hypothetical protein ACIBQ1_05265 [Nonomuraea sp. NPDC050153]|uniref:hypothetical protein n=1 Tax=Nonomuraea sp. NPDC050153 TaxID=3364359 RepID=UPI0037BA040D